MPTFPDLLAHRLARDPGRPFVTFYDEATSERTELSVTTYANWVSKTANLFVDELMLDPGEEVSLDLPTHWLGPVFLGAVWSSALLPAAPGSGAPVAVVGPEPVGAAGTVVACALRPFAVRYPEPLPEGVLDFGLLWPGQSDFFAPIEPTDLEVPEPRDDRVLTDLNPLDAAGQEMLLGLLAGTGSLVLLTGAADEQWPARAESERATATVRSAQPIN